MLDDVLPRRVLEIAAAFERFPHDPSRREFDSILGSAGLDVKSDWFQDEQHRWYFSSNFNSTSRADTSYLITIVYWPLQNSEIRHFDAAIHRLQSAEPGSETMWQIDYAKFMRDNNPFVGRAASEINVVYRGPVDGWRLVAQEGI